MVPLMIMAAHVAELVNFGRSLEYQNLNVSQNIAAMSLTGVEVIDLVISIKGEVVGCNARVVGHGAVNDRSMCKKLSKINGIPAIDQNGEKTYGSARLVFTWKIDRPGMHPTDQGSEGVADFYLPINKSIDGLRSSDLIVVAGADGKVESCEVAQSSGNSMLDNAACLDVQNSGVSPLKDEFGEAVRSVRGVEVGFFKQP